MILNHEGKVLGTINPGGVRLGLPFHPSACAALSSRRLHLQVGSARNWQQQLWPHIYILHGPEKREFLLSSHETKFTGLTLTEPPKVRCPPRVSITVAVGVGVLHGSV